MKCVEENNRILLIIVGDECECNYVYIQQQKVKCNCASDNRRYAYLSSPLYITFLPAIE